MQRIDRRAVVRLVAVAVASLARSPRWRSRCSRRAGLENASAVYLAAVVATAFVAGTLGRDRRRRRGVPALRLPVRPAAVHAHRRRPERVAQPRRPAVRRDRRRPAGRHPAVAHARSRKAREREARALFQVSRALATRESTPAVLPVIVGILRDETVDGAGLGLARRRRCRRARRGRHRAPTARPACPASTTCSSGRPTRRPPDGAGSTSRRRRARPGPAGGEAYRVRIEAGGRPFGSIWAIRDRDRGEPDRTETRLLSAAADQVGQALAQDRLAAEAQAAEIARQSDALKSALLQSVSHDLRTPLATIRAAAGTLRPGSGLSAEDQQESADAIDREVEYLNRLVTNLLDLSRIEAGALRADRDVYELDDLVGQTIDRLRRAARRRGR